MRPDLEARLGDPPRRRSEAQKARRRQQVKAKRAAQRAATAEVERPPRLRSVIVRPEAVPSSRGNIIVATRPRKRATLSNSRTLSSGYQSRPEERNLIHECYWSGSEESACSSHPPSPTPPATEPRRDKSRLQFDVPETSVPVRTSTRPAPPGAQAPKPRPPARETPPDRRHSPRTGLAALRDPRRFGKAKRRLILEHPARAVHYEPAQLPRDRSPSRRRALRRLRWRPREKFPVECPRRERL
ncbi:hypothetical protein QAD02_019668 [Eretmocerus hayati]|uniref:Uncharacterized protein n=1 Tax=Eretmocerus hayati TaxID=131215 RepID=A0ACC2PM40_9HYME|nr:hypothetical protein QAD02_019668 [Eretmocerus hayati]